MVGRQIHYQLYQIQYILGYRFRHVNVKSKCVLRRAKEPEPHVMTYCIKTEVESATFSEPQTSHNRETRQVLLHVLIMQTHPANRAKVNPIITASDDVP